MPISLFFRYHAWARKTKGKPTSAPQIASLPPTSEAFELNVRRGHLQCIIWNHTMCHDPPTVDEQEYGYDRNEEEETLEPTMLPPGVDVIPPTIRKILTCNCQANSPCGRGNCTCRKGNLGCSIFCKCPSLDSPYVNPLTTKNEVNNNKEDEHSSIATDDWSIWSFV